MTLLWLLVIASGLFAASVAGRRPGKGLVIWGGLFVALLSLAIVLEVS